MSWCVELAWGFEVSLHIITVAVLLLVCFSDATAAGLDGQIVWKTLEQGFEIAKDQQWNVKTLPDGSGPRSFVFTALRFHLGHYEMRLLDMSEFARTKSEEISRVQKQEKDLPALFELGVRTPYQINPFGAKSLRLGPLDFLHQVANRVISASLKSMER